MAALFEQKAPGIMRRLMADFALSPEQAAGIVGNLGHETGGFRFMQELKPVVAGSAGGFGWAQWTGPRRRAYFRWAKERQLDIKSDAANYGFLKYELQTSEAHALPTVKRTRTAADAAVAFEKGFERAGAKHYASRIAYAERALAAYGESPAQPDVENQDVAEAPEKTPANSKTIWAAIAGILASGGTALGTFFEALKDPKVALYSSAAAVVIVLLFIARERLLKIKAFGV